jgi:hypothetical protein
VTEWNLADLFGYPRGRHYAKHNWSAKLTPDQRIEAQRRATNAAGGSGGRVSGPKTVWNMIAKTTNEQRAIAGRKGGQVAGALNKGKRFVTNLISNQVRFVSPDKAQALVDTGKWRFGGKSREFIEAWRRNISVAAKSREARKRELHE